MRLPLRASERILAPRAHEAAVLLAFETRAVEEPLADRRVMTVAHRRDHVPAVVAEVLDRLLAGDVPLVRHEDREDEDERPDDQADHPALKAAIVLERQRAPGERHAPASRVPVQIVVGSNIDVRRNPNDKRPLISRRPPTSGTVRR